MCIRKRLPDSEARFGTRNRCVMQRRIWATLSLAIALSALAAPLLGQFVYVANASSNNVSGYTINPTTGALTAISGSPFAAGRFPTSMAVDPTAKSLY